MCGGIGELKKATAEIQKIADQVRQDAEEKANKKFAKYVPISFKTQVVAGTNYFIKVDIGDGCIHLRVYQPLPHTGQPVELAGIQLDKSLGDELTYF